MKKATATINRALISRKVFDSASLGVLASVLHRIDEPGEYTLQIRDGVGATRRVHVHVVREDAPRQVNIDLGQPSNAGGGCACHDTGGYTLLAGGMLCFFVSRGAREFTILLTTHGEKGMRTTLDTAKALAAGDVFAATLLRPGLYRATLSGHKAAMEVRVDLPKEAKGFDPRQGQMVPVGAAGFGKKHVQMFSGHSLAFVLEAALGVKLELVKPDHGDDEGLKYRKPGPGDKNCPK